MRAARAQAQLLLLVAGKEPRGMGLSAVGTISAASRNFMLQVPHKSSTEEGNT